MTIGPLRQIHAGCNLRHLFSVCAAWVLITHLWVPRLESRQVKDAPQDRAETLEARVQALEAEVEELKRLVKALEAQGSAPIEASVVDPSSPAKAPAETVSQFDSRTLEFLRDTTINLNLDTYYAYNFNHPVGRVNLLRAYDVLSNEFSLNQASVIFDHPPDRSRGHGWGGRLDLQFGQATAASQGNPANEPRPEIYRSIFQAYGSYMLPLGKGVEVDFGKWASALGIEGNYTKDQMNYSRSYWFFSSPFITWDYGPIFPSAVDWP